MSNMTIGFLACFQDLSSSCTGSSTLALLVSTMHPFISISSNTKCACT